MADCVSAAGASHDKTVEEVAIIWPKQVKSHQNAASSSMKKAKHISMSQADEDRDEPLVDVTAKLALHSKKTDRLRRKMLKKESRRVKSEIKSFLDLPSELLIEVLGHLFPSDAIALLRLSRFSREFILENESTIADRITQSRYWVLRQCFTLPVLLTQVPAAARAALLSPRWQERLKIHRNPYQHIQHIDPALVCTCMSCVLAWNNLNIVLDLSHWQANLENREPLPVIPRGSTPDWNAKLLGEHATIVEKAIASPLYHARILQTHLDSITRTIVRFSKWRKKGEPKNLIKPRLYRLSDKDTESGSDKFLDRSGPPSYQPIYMRDNYYSVEAFVPNRKRDKTEQTWKYYSKWPQPHVNDLSWVAARFSA